MSDLSNVPDDKLQEIIDIFEPQQENRRACVAEKIRRQNIRFQQQAEMAHASIRWSKIAAIAAIASVIATIVVFLLSKHFDISQQKQQIQQMQSTKQELKQTTKPMPTHDQDQSPSSTSLPPNKK